MQFVSQANKKLTWPKALKHKVNKSYEYMYVREVEEGVDRQAETGNLIEILIKRWVWLLKWTVF